MHMTASIGIAFAGRPDETAEELLHKADIAMYQAKRRGGAQHQTIDLRDRGLVDDGLSLRRDLRHAREAGQLRSEYQPIVSTFDGRIIGVEALVRWDHPSRGLVLPTTLIPLAEQSGLILEIGRWVLEQACPDRRRWRGLGQGEELGVSVNVSAHQLMKPDFTAVVEDVLHTTETDPGLLTLEITESAFIQDSRRAGIVLQDLKQLGVKLALDDFGTGYSSLCYLQQFPVDVVKIDKGFVAELGRDGTSHAIVSAIVDLAHTLGLTVVAEGVETARQYENVAVLGCDACQGHYFAPPMSADALDALINDSPPGANPRLPVPAGASQASG
jgi:EAL domain-containing protein (putative c-di-GMP-specific phosphodiesterase class I)